MLSWSAEETETPLDLRAVTDPSVDPLLPGGQELLRLVDTALGADPASTAGAVASVRAVLGEPGLVDAAAVIGNFQMMNRVADATGMPVGKGSRVHNAELIARLGLDRFDHLDAER